MQPIAFYVPTQLLVHHFEAVIEHLDPGSFEVVTTRRAGEAELVERSCAERGWPLRYLGDVVREGRHYRAVVSNHPGSLVRCGECDVTQCVHLPKPATAIEFLSDTSVRFLYSLGKTDWNLRDWNELYDLILVFGPRQADAFRRFERARILQMGYPRYDRLMRGEIDRDELHRRFGLDPAQPTIVWLPTWSTSSSIDAFAEPIARLATTHQVVVKPHPHTVQREEHRMELLRRLPFARLVDEPVDSVEMIALADTVLADYGGSAFGAIYADKSLLLLNVPGSEGDAFVGRESYDVELRRTIASVEMGNADWMATMLGNESIWEQQQAERARLRAEFFAPTYGFSGEIAAAALRNLELVLGRPLPPEPAVAMSAN